MYLVFSGQLVSRCPSFCMPWSQLHVCKCVVKRMSRSISYKNTVITGNSRNITWVWSDLCFSPVSSTVTVLCSLITYPFLIIQLECPEHVLNEGHEMKTIQETMSIIHFEKNHRRINTLEEIEILKAASFKHLLNDVIAEQNDPIYKLLPPSVIWTPRSIAQAKQTNKKIQNFKNQQLQ